MPDTNKHDALAKAGFAIQNVCATCIHWKTETVTSWGVCRRIPYEHVKHSGVKLAGTPAIGGCPSHQPHIPDVVGAVGEDYAYRHTNPPLTNMGQDA